MESGQGTLDGLRDMLNSVGGQVFIRLAVDAGHAVRYIDVIVAAPAEPPGWKPMHGSTSLSRSSRVSRPRTRWPPRSIPVTPRSCLSRASI